MRHASHTFIDLKTLSRAAVIALGAAACAGLSACAYNEPAVSGSSMTSAPAWVHTPNEPDWQSLPYKGGP
jgi:hypothetical protein